MFRFYSNSTTKQPRVAVVGEHSEGMLKIAVSRCSEKENFIHVKGRKIAEGRLRKGKTYTEIPMETCNIHTFVTKAKEISQEVITSKKIY